MRSRRLGGFVLAGFAVLLLAWPASAQVDLERFAPALDADGFLGVQGTRTPGKDRASYSLFGHYASSLLVVSSEGGKERSIVAERLSGVLAAEAGLGERVAIGLSLPVVLHQDGDKLAASDPALPATALADPRAHLRYRFLGSIGASRNEQRDGPGLALQLTTALPAGALAGYAGEGVVRSELQLLADLHLLGAGVGASIGLRHRYEPRTALNVRLRDEFTFGAALKVPVPPLYPLAVLVEVRGATDFASKQTTALEGEVGAMLPIGDFSVVLAAGAGLSEGVGTPGARIVAGFWFTPGDPDSDGDGVPDSLDQCPFLPEDRDGFQDADGCPDPDNDNDLIPDADDLCPNDQAIEGRDENEDGCTDKPR